MLLCILKIQNTGLQVSHLRSNPVGADGIGTGEAWSIPKWGLRAATFKDSWYAVSTVEGKAETTNMPARHCPCKRKDRC